jgi:hypothetical protein
VSATAYVLYRERIIRAPGAIAASLTIPLASGGGKMIEEKHWASDVLGGLLAATAISSGFLAAYESGRR